MLVRRLGSRTKLALFALIASLVGCALSYEPGSFRSGTVEGEAGAIDGGSTQLDGAFILPDGAVASRQILYVLAGERDGSDTSTSDFWVAPIDDVTGDLGAFTTLQPGLFRGGAAASTVSSGRFFVAMRSGRAIEHLATTTTGLDGNWVGTAAPGVGVFGFGAVFSGSTIVTLGGATSVTVDGGTTTTRDDKVRLSAFDDTDGGVFKAVVDSTTRLPLALYNMQVVRYKDFVYIVGGDSGQSDQSNKVYVAPIDPTQGVGAFTPTTSITNPATGLRHAPANLMVCAVEATSMDGAARRGRLVVAGGDATDVVLSAPIDAATGALGSWQAARKLPGALKGAGCAYFHGTLHFVGGFGATSRTDRIVRAPFFEDGTSGEWDLSSGERLPIPRSNIVTLVVDRVTGL